MLRFPNQDYQLSPPRRFEKTLVISNEQNCQYNPEEYKYKKRDESNYFLQFIRLFYLSLPSISYSDSFTSYLNLMATVYYHTKTGATLFGHYFTAKSNHFPRKPTE